MSRKSSGLKWAPQILEVLDGFHNVFCGPPEEEVADDSTSFLIAILHLRFVSGSVGKPKRPGSVPLHLGTTHGAGMAAGMVIDAN